MPNGYPDKDKRMKWAADLVQQHGTCRAAAKASGAAISTVSRWYNRAVEAGLAEARDEVLDKDTPVASGEERFEDDLIGDDTRRIQSQSSRIKTVDEAIAKAGVDTRIWEAGRCKVKSWECTTKHPTTGEVTVTPMWGVTVELRRRAPKPLQEAALLIVADIKKYKPAAYKPLKQAGVESDPHLFVPGLFDAHFGKLAWGQESGESYDLKIAEQLFVRAAETLLKYASNYPIELIELPLGQDFIHIDNNINSTANNTPQDVDGRLPKIIRTAWMACIRVIDLFKQVAPVSVRWVPGNHDWLTSMWLCHILEAHYNGKDSRVTVDVGPAPRKYIEYGTTLIATTHGKYEKHKELPLIMATEQPDAWARTKCHEWMIGHFHKRREMDFVGTDSFAGVVVRTLPSLSARDAWHNRMGYVNSDRAAEGYLYSKTRGYVGHFSAQVDT